MLRSRVFGRVQPSFQNRKTRGLTKGKLLTDEIEVLIHNMLQGRFIYRPFSSPVLLVKKKKMDNGTFA